MTDERLTLFLPALHGGGAERNILILGDAFAERGYDVDLVVSVTEGPYLEQIPDTVNLVDLGARRALTSLPALVRYLRRREPAAILSTLPNANVVGLLARKLAGVDARYVVREANMVTPSSRHSGSWIGRNLPRVMRFTYPLADQVVGVSRGVAEDIQETCDLDPDKVTVVHNPVVVPELFEQASEPIDHAWFDSDEPIVLAVGNLSVQKDYPTLIEAFRRVRNRRPARLVVLGKGPIEGQLRQMVWERDLALDVDLHGWVPNPFAYMARADVLALSSRWEGLPNVLIQAMAVGTPVVSTDCRSGPREILSDGEHGRLVPIGDVEALADGLLDVLEDPPETKPARQRARDFSVGEVAEAWLDEMLPERR